MNSDVVAALCRSEPSRDPIAILEKLMSLPDCRMHGPEHHVLVGCALLTAYKNAGGEVDLPGALAEMARRGEAVPGGACGAWGACGAGLSTGQFLSIVTNSSPLAVKPWGTCIRMSACALECIGQVDGPRCCKRDSYLSVLAAVDFAAEHLNIHMEKHVPVCTRSGRNEQCIRTRCPFFGGNT